VEAHASHTCMYQGCGACRPSSVALPAAAQDASGPILFSNVNVFDGVAVVGELRNEFSTGNFGICAVSVMALSAHAAR